MRNANEGNNGIIGILNWDKNQKLLSTGSYRREEKMSGKGI